jgi:hypothetical protein
VTYTNYATKALRDFPDAYALPYARLMMSFAKSFSLTAFGALKNLADSD